jgi:hypothetical protein
MGGYSMEQTMERRLEDKINELTLDKDPRMDVRGWSMKMFDFEIDRMRKNLERNREGMRHRTRIESLAVRQYWVAERVKLIPIEIRKWARDIIANTVFEYRAKMAKVEDNGEVCRG